MAAAAAAATDVRPTDADDAGAGDSLDGDRGHGHFFSKKTFHRPTYCHHCTDMLWGLIGQGYLCEGLSPTRPGRLLISAVALPRRPLAYEATSQRPSLSPAAARCLRELAIIFGAAV